MRNVLFIAGRDIRFMLRERATILWAFVMPILFFYFIGTITGGYGGNDPDRPDPLAIEAPADAGMLADRIRERLVERNYRIVPPSDTTLFASTRRRLVLPAAMTDSALAGHPVDLHFKATGDGTGTEFDEIRVGRAVYTVLADMTVLTLDDREITPAAFTALRNAPRSLALRVSAAGARRRVPSGFEQAVPGILVMFTVLVLLTTGAILFVVERRLGLLKRLSAAPISKTSIVAGKWGSRMVLALIQIGFALLSGTVLFHMKWGPDFPAVLLVLFVWAGLNASLGLLLGTVARSEGQAVGIGVFAANILGALGGCWWPIEVAPKWMQTLSLFLPTGWAMNALHKLISFGAGPASVVPHLLVMTAAALGFAALAVRFFRYD